MTHIDPNCRGDSQLQFESICSIEIFTLTPSKSAIIQYDGPVEVSSDDLSSSDSDSETAEDDTDPNAVDEPPLDDGDDVTEEDADEAFETG